MTILQLKYVLVIAGSSSIREASSKLFISQPALSASVHELEEELGIKIFTRNNKGISLSEEGREFISYAKQAVSQYELIEGRYLFEDNGKKHFSVSMQHYVFAVQAFVNVVKKYESSQYVYSVHETRTDEVLSNVKAMKSEIGIVSYTSDNEYILKKLFKEYQLDFHALMVKDTYVYVWKEHPIANKTQISISELSDYPCVSFDQSSESPFYITEEALSSFQSDKTIKSNDRATSLEIMAELNGYSIGIGNLTESKTLKEGFVAIKLLEEDPLTIGYITRKNHKLSDIGEDYLRELKSFCDK